MPPTSSASAITAEYFALHRAGLRRYVQSCTHHRDDTEDIVMRAFEKFHRCAQGVEPGKRKNYLFSIAHRLILDRARDQNRRPTVSLDDLMDEEAGTGYEPTVSLTMPEVHQQPCEHLVRREMQHAVRQSVAASRERNRDALIEHHFKNVPIPEMELQSGIPSGTIKTRLMRGREEVEKKLRGYMATD